MNIKRHYQIVDALKGYSIVHKLSVSENEGTRFFQIKCSDTKINAGEYTAKVRGIESLIESPFSDSYNYVKVTRKKIAGIIIPVKAEFILQDGSKLYEHEFIITKK